ncbi:MAG: YARHG domain-containing protein [Spirochaetaceae bacterium]|jgi:hypothetical protein|nr:YARHG domain-containing protein [Spirochaetaceae bacterium]
MKKAYNIMYLFVFFQVACTVMAQGQSAKYREIIEKGKLTPLASLLSEKELAQFSKDELRIIRNTIFAQYGFTFGVEDLKKHFEQFAWYKATGSNVDQYLTDIDRENIRIIQALESNAAALEEVKSDNLIYVEIQQLTSPTIITFQSVDEFRKLIQQYNITVILYNANTFYFENNTLMYSIASNGYKKITEYENGFKLGFKNGESYYFALDNKLSNQEEVDYYKAQNYITSADFFDARSMGLISNTVQNKIVTVTGLIRKSNFQKLSRYINILLYSNNSGSMPLEKINTTDIEEIVRRSNGYIRPFGETMYYVSIPVNYRGDGYYRGNRHYGSGSGIGDDALFYYALKIAQYSNIEEYIKITGNNNYMGIMNSRDGNHYNIKDNEKLTVELGYKTYADFEDSMGRNITNSKDYYIVKQYY